MIYIFIGLPLFVFGLILFFLYHFKVDGQFGYKSLFLNALTQYGIVIFGFPGLVLIVVGVLRILEIL